MAIAMLESRRLVVGGEAVRVTSFPQTAYGHTCLEMQTAAALARREGSSLLFLPSPLRVNDGLFSLVFDDVPVLDPAAPLARAARDCWLALERAVASDLRQARLLAHHLQTDVFSGRLQLVPQRFALHGGWPYYRRRLLREPARARLPAALVPALRRTARQLGVADEARLVSLYVREDGWYGRLGRSGEERTYNRHRCADIASYVPAVDWLVQQGFTVVRMGDASMRPFERPGCLDLATDPRRTDRLELHLLGRSAFAITGDSGPTHAAMLLDRPVLLVNIACPVMGFPIRADSLACLKLVRHRATGRPVTLAERFGEDFNRYPMDRQRFSIHDNTPDELLAAVREMVAFQQAPGPETPDQDAYGQRVRALAADAQPRIPMFLKWGPDDGFLGSGRMGQAWLDRHLASLFADQDPAPPQAVRPKERLSL